MKLKLVWSLLLLALIMTSTFAQYDGGVDAADDGAEVGAEDGAEDSEDSAELKFIGDGESTKHLEDVESYNPNVMIHNDARDVLRKVIKEKSTAFFIQFYKGTPDRDLRDDI